MKRAIIVAAIAALALSQAACATNDNGSSYGNKQTLGTIVGGGLGGLGGAQIGKGKGNTVAIILGTLLGAAAGNQAGQSLDRADQLAAQQTRNVALESSPTGRSRGWSNPDNGNYGSVTPTNTYQRSDGQYCREYQQTVTINGQTQQAYGTACRQQDGSWQVVNTRDSRYQQWRPPR